MSDVKIQRKVGKALVEVFAIDATPSHEVTMNSVITEHPTEGGSTITHNFRKEPKELTMTGFVSNYPVRIGLGLVPFKDESRGQTAMEALEEIRDNKELVQITDHLKVYENMGMGALSFPINARTYNGLQFTATFKQVRIVGVQVAQLEDDAQVQAAATPTADRGKQTPTDATDEAEVDATVLWRAKRGITSALGL